MDVSLLSLVFKPKKYIFRVNEKEIIVENELCDNNDNFELVIPKINGKVSQFNKNSNKYYFKFTNSFQEKLFKIYLKHFNIKYENYLEILDKSILNILSDEEFTIELPPIDYEIKKLEGKYTYEKKLWKQNNYCFKSYQRNILENGNHEIILNMNWNFNLEIRNVNDDNFLITLENRGCNYFNLFGYEKNSPTEIIENGEKILFMRTLVGRINDGENIAVKFEVNKFPMYIVNHYLNKSILEITEDKIKINTYDSHNFFSKEIILQEVKKDEDIKEQQEDINEKSLFKKFMNKISSKKEEFSPTFIPEKMEFDFCDKILKTEDNDYNFLTSNKKNFVFFENKNIIPIYFKKQIAMTEGKNDKYILWEVKNNYIFSPTSF